MESDTKIALPKKLRNPDLLETQKHHWETNSLPKIALANQHRLQTLKKILFFVEWNYRKKSDTIQEIQHVTEDNDANGLLNKQGGYTASIYFSDSRQQNLLTDWSSR